MRKAILLAVLIASPVLGQQNIIIVQQGRTDGGSGIVPVVIPTPDFSNQFNDGSGATATSSVGDNCSLASTSWVEDPPSSGNWELDYAGAFAECGTALDSLPSGTAFTVSAWINLDSYGDAGFGRIICKHTSTTVSWCLMVNDFSSNGWAQLIVQDTSSASDNFRTPIDSMEACIGVWCHIVAVITNCAGTMSCSGQLYINGVPVTTTQQSDATGTARTDTAYSVELGMLAAAGANAFDGDIDDINVWATVALDADQVLLLNSLGRQ